MDELIKKIIALRDLAKSLTAKPNSNSMVPSIKPPTTKPLSLPSMTGAAPTKIPGVAVPSGKDPKAMAAQLKNPRPTKPPKIEVLKADKNGQWYLEKDMSGTMMPDGDC